MAECSYCGESFDSEHEKGVHVAEEHTEDNSIPRKKSNCDRKKNIIDDKWDTDE